MKSKDPQLRTDLKNEIIIMQAKRIMLLEEKFNDLREKYNKLRYRDSRELRVV